MKKPTTTHRPQRKQQGKSPSLTAFVDPSRDLLAEFAAYEHKVEKGDKHSIPGCPEQLKNQVELLALKAKPRRPLEAAAAFTIREGSIMLERIPAIAVIRSCREVVLASGSGSIVKFGRFAFEIPSPDSERTRFWYRLPHEDATRCGRISLALGLPPGKVAALSIMSTLIHVSVIPADIRLGMRDAVKAFIGRVNERAKDAKEIRDRVSRRAPEPELSLSFDQLLEEMGEDEEE